MVKALLPTLEMTSFFHLTWLKLVSKANSLESHVPQRKGRMAQYEGTYFSLPISKFLRFAQFYLLGSGDRS